MRNLMLLLFALFFMGCTQVSKDDCGDKFLLLWPDSKGQQSFQEIRLSTLSSPYEVKGSVARVYFESGLQGRGFEGPVARPRLTRSGDTCVPMDVESASALVAYAQMEKLYAFDQQMGFASALSWPRQVGIQIHVRSPDGNTHNNAHYFPKDDAIAVIPYNMNGVPMAFNHGILAHEHFHAHFQNRVVNLINQALEGAYAMDQLFYPAFNMKPMADDYDRIDLRTINGLNNFVLRAWNEGLADFYGYIFTQNTNFVVDSRPEYKGFRDVSGPLVRLQTGASFAASMSTTNLPSSEVVGLSYQQGTLMARVFYQLAVSGLEAPEAFMQRVMRRLPFVAEAMSKDYASKIYDFDAIIPIVLEGMDQNRASCEALRAALSEQTFQGSFSSCSNM